MRNHEGASRPAGGEEIEFRKIEQFTEPVTWDELQALPALANCEPLQSNQGSLFAVTADEYDAIRALIDERNVVSHSSSPPLSRKTTRWRVCSCRRLNSMSFSPA